jgi:hypothetical protein
MGKWSREDFFRAVVRSVREVNCFLAERVA